MCTNCSQALLLVNFGGPREQKEVEPFLIELLSDQDVLQTKFPPWLHRLLFTYVAKKRAKLMRPEYQKIGGSSPLFIETELLAKRLRKTREVISFHRYLSSTHQDTLQRLQNCSCQEIIVFPCFPQFSYTTTGSIARFFLQHLPSKVEEKLQWIPSYYTHSAFLDAHRGKIQILLDQEKIQEEDLTLLFSAHGLPAAYRDPYLRQCQASHKQICAYFPKAKSILAFQSQFGKKEWLRPYTKDVAQSIVSKHTAIVPLSFISDHLETLYEIKEQYLPLIRNQAHLVETIGLDEQWILPILDGRQTFVTTRSLIRNGS